MYINNDLFVGTRIKLIDTPDYCKEIQNDLGRTGIITAIYYDSTGVPSADILLDGDEGLSVCFINQLQSLK